MPITNSFDPENLPELKRKLIATNYKPHQEEYVCKQVQSHLNKWGDLSYLQAPTKIEYFPLPASKCIVFLIRGEFSVGSPSSEADMEDATWENTNEEWRGHLVEDESTLQLHKETAVVIIELN